MGHYLPSTAAEQNEMLAEMGCTSFDELYSSIPTEVLFNKELDIPSGESEFEVLRDTSALAAKNTVFPTIFRGAGAYRHFIPPLVKAIMGKEEFSTAYTPYQAEISQGVLQSIFEYQTMVCQLTGMDASNASVYDGATAAAEALIMCQDRKRSRVVASAAMNPQTLEVMKTYATSRSIEMVVVPAPHGITDLEAFKAAFDEHSACGIFQQPNYFGVLEDSKALINAAHEAGARAIMSVEPISLGILDTPGAMGADICVAEGQPLGLPLSFGGPYLGIMTCTEALTRHLPGRIAGQTQDAQGNRAFVLTLQAREQHIRREKASSNVCSNEALCALGAGVYLASMGPDGLAQAARLSYAKAHYLADQLTSIKGISLAFDQPFFNEFVTTCPMDAHKLERVLADHGILSGLPLDNTILWCATEVNSKEEIDTLVALVKKEVAACN